MRWSKCLVILAIVHSLVMANSEVITERPARELQPTWEGEEELPRRVVDVPVLSPDIKSPDYLEKLRFNYAAEQCGAKILETSGVAGGADNILSGSLDSYLLGYCNKEIWAVIELCEEIAIDSLLIGNMEFFSSNFREFSVYGSKNFPETEWIHLQNFTAQNVKVKQTFEFEKKAIYKYLKVKFHSHYGHEYYCPVTVLKIYGYTLVEDLREQVEMSQVKLQTFNKLMNEASLREDKSDWEELPLIPSDICPLDDSTILSPEDMFASHTDILQRFSQLFGESDLFEGDSDPDKDPALSGSNIFVEMAQHITRLEMRHSLLSRYMDQFRSSCSKKFDEIFRREGLDTGAVIEEIANSTAPLKKSITELQLAFKSIRRMNARLDKLRYEVHADRDIRSSDLLITVAVSMMASVTVTVILICLIFEVPRRTPDTRSPVRKRWFRTLTRSPPPLSRTTSYSGHLEDTSASHASNFSPPDTPESLTPPVTSPKVEHRTHRKQHST